MKYCHNITVRVFAKPDEDAEAIKKALLSLFPFSLEEQKIPVAETRATGADEKSIITIHEVTLEKDKHINAFIEHLKSHLSAEQREMVICQHNRLDNHHYFYIRLDKPKLLDGVYWVTDSGKCFHIRLCIASYPKTREKSLAVVKEIFKP